MQLCHDRGSWSAGLDTSTGLCCPSGMSEVLSHSFQLADARLLDYLAGKLLSVVGLPKANAALHQRQGRHTDPRDLCCRAPR